MPGCTAEVSLKVSCGVGTGHGIWIGRQEALIPWLLHWAAATLHCPVCSFEDFGTGESCSA